MNLKILLTLAVLLPAFSVFAKDAGYNREKCDKKIGVNKFIVAGSLDNADPGGKTYSFDRIVGSIENELLGGSDPRPEEFACYTDLFAKAHTDAVQYWSQTMARTSCADKEGNVASVKPDDCPESVWMEYHRSKELIEVSVARVDRVTKECVEKNGRKSCDSMASLQALEDVATPLAASDMDRCCNIDDKKNPGPAFRVLRSFYTFEYGSLSDAELQKECYKRTRPNTDGVLATSARMIGNCIKGLAFGFFESIKKSASTLAKLLDFGMWTELAKLMFTQPISTIIEKIGNLVKAIYDQVAAQSSAFVGCFSGPYQADQACKMVSSLMTDYFTGGGLVKLAKGLIATVKGGAGAASAVAKGLLAESPKAKLLQGKLQEMAKTTSVKAPRAVKAVSSQVTSAAKVAATKLANMRRSVGSFKEGVKKGIVEARTRAGETVAGQGRLARTSPNASTTVTPPAPTATVAQAAQSTTSTASTAASTVARSELRASGNIKLTSAEKSAARIQSDLKPFELKLKTRKNPEYGLVDPKKFAGRSKSRQLALIEEGAARRKVQVDILEKSKGTNKISSDVAARMRQNIDDAVAEAKRKYGLDAPNAGMANVASGSGAGGTISGGSISTPTIAPVTGIADSAVPTVAATSSGATAVVGGTSSGTSTIASNMAKLDLNAIVPTPTKLPASAQNTWNNLSTYVRKAQDNVNGATPSSVRTNVYGGKGDWGVSRESLRRHRDIQEMYRRGTINDDQARALHDIVVSTEKMATGSATRYSTNYVVSPNANPSTFSTAAKPSTKQVVAQNLARGGTGAAASAGQYNRNLDENSGQRYDSDTLSQSIDTVDELSSSSSSVKVKFDDLTTEEEILNMADTLRARVKTVEINFGAIVEEERRTSLNQLLVKINKERDRALVKIGKTPPAESAESERSVASPPAAATSAPAAAPAQGSPEAPATAPTAPPLEQKVPSFQD